MKHFLAVAIIAAIVVTVVNVAQSAPPDTSPVNYDINRNGNVTLADVLVVLRHVGDMPGTPEACLHVLNREHYTTPVTAYQDATPYLVEGRAYPDPNDPLVPALLSGTPVAWCQ